MTETDEDPRRQFNDADTTRRDECLLHLVDTVFEQMGKGHHVPGVISTAAIDAWRELGDEYALRTSRRRCHALMLALCDLVEVRESGTPLSYDSPVWVNARLVLDEVAGPETDE